MDAQKWFILGHGSTSGGWNVHRIYLLAVWCFLSLSCGIGTSQAPRALPEHAPQSAPGAHSSFDNLSSFDNVDQLQEFAKPRTDALAVNFGRVVQVKAVYSEKRESSDGSHPESADANVRRHFGLLATSALPGTPVTGEGELAYSHLGLLGQSCDCSERPMMMRLAFKSRWDALSYGGNYRSFEPGFVSLAGITTDVHRDEGEFWGERSWGALRIRGALTQSWEKPRDADGVRVTRSAAATFNYNKPQWAGSFASSYSLMQPESASDRETTITNHRITASYRPITSISLSPSLSFTQEWNPATGNRLETPGTGLAFAYTPFKDWLRLSSDTTLTRSFTLDGSNDTRIFDTGAALDWKIGKFIGRADRLSLSVNYSQRLDLVSPSNSQQDVRSMLLLQVTGF
jgi:hypothetical protein